MDQLKAAVIQMTSGEHVLQNLERASTFITNAAKQGATFIALPENFAFLSTKKIPPAEDFDNPGPILSFGKRLAQQFALYLLLGSIPEKSKEKTKVYNTSVLFGPNGDIVARYRKIHLFDFHFREKSFRESDTISPGDTPCVAKTEFGILGLSICYDLRFPELYRELSKKGVTVLCAPSAFTVATGTDHWEILLRARAIENQCFLLAPAQFGKHASSQRSYGRSMIVDPWGLVLCCVPDEEGFAIATLNFALQSQIRKKLPVLNHRVFL